MRDRPALIFLSVLLAGLALLCFLIARPFLGPMAFAALLAVGFYPLHASLKRRTSRPTLAALISTLFLLVVILLPLALVVVRVGGEVNQQYKRLKTASEQEGGVAPYLEEKAQDVVSWVAPRLRISEQELSGAVTSHTEEVAKWAAKNFAVGLLAAGSWIIDTALAGVILFFFLRDGPHIVQKLMDLLPLRREDSRYLVEVMNESIRANFHGVVGVALAQGLLTGIGLAIAGIPSPATWGVIAAFSSMFPMVGSALVWVPATIWLLVSGSYGMAIFLAVWGMVVVGLADNLLRPLVVGGQTDQHPMLIFLSMIGGTAFFGVLGLFLGPLVVAVTIGVLEVFRRKVSAEKATSELAGLEL